MTTSKSCTTSGPARRVRETASWLAWAVAATTVALAVTAAFLTHSAMPYEDEWYSLDLFRSFSASPSFAALASLHNEHRILFPRLLFWSDYAWWGGTGVPDVATTFLVQAAAAALYARLAWRALPPGTWRAAWAALPFPLLFSLRQEENFAWAFQTQFAAVFALAAAATCLGVASVRDGRTRPLPLAGSLALQAVAAFTMANGFLAGLSTALAMACMRSRAWVLPTVASCACLAAYLHGFERPEGGQPLSAALSHPFVAASFAMAYLGSFLDPSVAASACLGVVGVALVARVGWRAATGRERDPAALAMLGIAAFVVASAAVTAVGRSVDDFGEATASRYATGAATFWAVALPLARRNLQSWRPGAGKAAAAMALLVAVVSVAGDWRGLREMRSHAFLRSSDEDGLLLGLLDLDAFRRDESGDLVASVTPFLRERGIGPFAGRDAALPGSPLASAGTPTGASCPGALAATPRPSLGPDAVAMEGLDPVRTFLPGPRRVVVADAAGRIAGLGSAGPGMGGRWSGYARAASGSVLTAYAVSDLGRLCRLGAVAVAAPG